MGFWVIKDVFAVLIGGLRSGIRRQVLRSAVAGCATVLVMVCFVAEGMAFSVSTAQWTGQTLYLPVYSHVFHGNQKPRGPRFFDLSVTVSVRNTSQSIPITVSEVRYVNAEGKTVRSYLEKPMTLQPLSAHEFYVDEKDSAGGTGASFIIVWKADAAVTAPVVESVMIGTKSSQGISYITGAHLLSGTVDPAGKRGCPRLAGKAGNVQCPRADCPRLKAQESADGQ